MSYNIPTKQFNAAEWITNKVLSVEQRKRQIIDSFILDYESFWGVSGADDVTVDEEGVETTTFVGNDCKHSQSEWQAMMDFMGVDILAVLQDAAAQRDWIISVTDPAEGEEPGEFTLPERYRTPAFELSYTAEGVTVGQLRDVWVSPSKETL